jgi:autotransporter-associated beta strand protein
MVFGESLTVDAGEYSVRFLDGGVIGGHVTFANTGEVEFGDEAQDEMVFRAGVKSTVPEETTIRGELHTLNTPIELGKATWCDVVVNAGTSTVFLTGDVESGGLAAGHVNGKIDLGGERTITVLDGDAPMDLTFYGAIVNGGLIKEGPGVLQLGGASEYAGGTTINGGTLLANNAEGSATGSGLVTIHHGTLGGHGRVKGVKVLSAGELSPGNTDTGFLRTAGVQFVQGALFQVELNAPYKKPAVHYDGVVVNGKVNLSKSTLRLTGDGLKGKPGTLIWLIVNDGKDKVVGTFAGLPEKAIVRNGKLKGRISYRGGTGNDVVILVIK